MYHISKSEAGNYEASFNIHSFYTLGFIVFILRSYIVLVSLYGLV